jgi:ClpP class serine protease
LARGERGEIEKGRLAMSIGDVLWLFFMISALQPVLRQKMLEAARMRVLHRFESSRKSRVIALVHRQETMSFLGFPIMRYIDVNDSEEVLRAIKLTDPDCPIDLIVHTPGGLVLAAGQIAHALRRHRAKVTVFVPHYAMSGGTLISLAADEIVLDPNAVLGPVDPQLGESPAASVLSVLDKKKPDDIEDKTFILADVSRKAITQVRRTVQDLLSERMPTDQAAALAEKLATGTWTHDYPIMAEEAKALGLPVSTEMPEEVYQFMGLFPQPTRTRPSVEYVPTPYRARHS